MSLLVATALAGVGILAGPVMRAEIFTRSAPAGQAWRRRCPHCREQITSRTRAGLVTPLSPSGLCPRCRQRFGHPPGSVEVVAAVVLAAIGWWVSEALAVAMLAWVALVGIVLAFVDLRVHRLPNPLIAAALIGQATVLSVGVILGVGWSRLAVAVLCAIATFAVYLLLAVIPRGYGLGDAKLALVTGLAAGWLGAGTAAMALVVGLLMSGLVAAVLLGTGRGRHHQLPHGPFMLAGVLVAIGLTG